MPLYVNKVEITDEAVFREMQFHPAPSREAARDEAAKALLIRELLRQEAVEKGFLPPETGAQTDAGALDEGIMKLIEQEVAAPAATDAVCRRYYDQNIDRFYAGEGTKIPQPFEKVKYRIQNYLHTRSVRHGIQSYILDLASKSQISGFDLAASL